MNKKSLSKAQQQQKNGGGGKKQASHAKRVSNKSCSRTKQRNLPTNICMCTEKDMEVHMSNC